MNFTTEIQRTRRRLSQAAGPQSLPAGCSREDELFRFKAGAQFFCLSLCVLRVSVASL